ncbi:hypothetical protein [Pseudoneobacillus sp. C159]
MSINKYQDSKVFTPKKRDNLSNQQSYRLNYLSEYLSEQMKQNQSITENLNKITSSMNETQKDQVIKMNEIISGQQQQTLQSNQFINKILSQEKINEEIITSLNQLKGNHIEMGKSLQTEQQINQAILDQLNFQDQQFRETNKRLENYVTLATKLSEQLLIQEQILKGMGQKLDVQDVYHTTVMNKLEKQEALNEKIIRQIDHLKSIVYERATLILEKVEQSFQSTSEYFQEIFTKAGFSKPFLLQGRPKEKTSDEETNHINKT